MCESVIEDSSLFGKMVKCASQLSYTHPSLFGQPPPWRISSHAVDKSTLRVHCTGNNKLTNIYQIATHVLLAEVFKPTQSNSTCSRRCFIHVRWRLIDSSLINNWLRVPQVQLSKTIFWFFLNIFLQKYSNLLIFAQIRWPLTSWPQAVPTSSVLALGRSWSWERAQMKQTANCVYFR